MNTFPRRLLFWAPRGICIAFAIFLSLFALDVFGEGYGVWKTILALLIHLVPVYIVLIVLALAWRWEWVGAAAFGALGVLYAVWAWPRMPSAILPIAGSLLVIATLFFVNWLKHNELHNRTR